MRDKNTRATTNEERTGGEQALEVVRNVALADKASRTWSSTRLKTYLTCARQYRYAYVDGIPSIPTAALVFGQMIHETLCYVQEYQMRTRRLPNFPDVLIHYFSSIRRRGAKC